VLPIFPSSTTPFRIEPTRGRRREVGGSVFIHGPSDGLGLMAGRGGCAFRPKRAIRATLAAIIMVKCGADSRGTNACTCWSGVAGPGPRPPRPGGGNEANLAGAARTAWRRIGLRATSLGRPRAASKSQSITAVMSAPRSVLPAPGIPHRRACSRRRGEAQITKGLGHDW